jgi:hypothetical protein
MDVVTLARTARENLARGLGALQSPGVPDQLMAAAEPIAQAMNALHRIESSRGGSAGDAQGALAQVRKALSELQVSGVHHIAVDQATEAIAGALGLVHQLSVAAPQASVMPSPPTQPSGSFPAAAAPPPQVAVVNQPAWQPPPQAAPAQQPANPVAATQLASNWAGQTAPAGGQVWNQPPPNAAPAAYPAAAPAPAYPAAAPAPAYPAPAPAPAYPAAAHTPAEAMPGPGGTLRYEAELGAHSSTNFYKGLSGNDVIDSGGIFIATYNIPSVGQPLTVKVSLPGGYEFEATAVVRWTRDSPQSGADSSPGFGAQFTQISAEGRQLVYRYVRNREPLFYDDL